MDPGGQGFGKSLAHNDKAIRDKAIVVLKAFLSRKAEISELEIMKLWKGLFYSMWMSDKRPVQFELCLTISSLIEAVHPNAQMTFIKAFYVTIHREWAGIDRLRLNKFYAFIAEFMKATFKALAAADWDEEQVTIFAASLKHGPLTAKLDKSLGFKYAVVEKFWPCLKAAVGDEEVPPHVITMLLEPFLYLLSRGKDKTLIQRIEEHVFLPLLPGSLEEEEEPLVCDIETVIKLLFERATHKSTQERNRSLLYGLHGKFENALGELAEIMAGLEGGEEMDEDEEGEDEVGEESVEGEEEEEEEEEEGQEEEEEE